jgi:hypothetical protein
VSASKKSGHKTVKRFAKSGSVEFGDTVVTNSAAAQYGFKVGEEWRLTGWFGSGVVGAAASSGDRVVLRKYATRGSDVRVEMSARCVNRTHGQKWE